jgi:hypothetical protein
MHFKTINNICWELTDGGKKMVASDARSDTEATGEKRQSPTAALDSAVFIWSSLWVGLFGGVLMAFLLCCGAASSCVNYEVEM